VWRPSRGDVDLLPRWPGENAVAHERRVDDARRLMALRPDDLPRMLRVSIPGTDAPAPA
jgi:hypothetical protein